MNVAAVAGGGRASLGSSVAIPKRAPLSMYADAPSEMVTLEDFEVLAFERLKVLKAIENAKSRGVKARDLSQVIRDAAIAHLGKETDAGFARKDSVSHHILRLAYCASDENRKWFLNYEAMLFRWRAENRSGEEIADFMADNGLHFVAVSEEEKKAVLAQLRQVAEANASMAGPDAAEEPTSMDTQFFKIPFLQALDLIRNRSVFLKGGFAYVPRTRMVSILVGRFRKYLSFNLVYANRFLPEVLRDERLKPMLENMSKAYTGPDYGSARKSVDRVGPEDIDALAASGMPLCMQNMHLSLRETHRIKHLGRLQYGLFLKGVGLSMEDALLFWQKEFTKGMSGEEFTKKYAYNIRYNYGKEGKRADFSPYSCVKIITAPAPTGDEAHGCPYKNWDVTSLRVALGKMKVTGGAVDSIVESVRGRDYQIACRKTFEARYPGADSGNVGNHPNAFTEAAIKALKGDDSAGAKPGTSSFSNSSLAVGSGAGGGAGAGVGTEAAAPPSPGGTASAVTELVYDDI